MLFAKIKKLNSSAYLTLMSIVQGVSLSFFTFYVLAHYQKYTISSWLMVVSTLFLLILTWFEYLVGVSVLMWVHGFLDSFIPFLLFCSEIILIHTMGEDGNSWFLGMMILCVTAMVAFGNMYWKAGQEKENAGLLRYIGKMKLLTFIYLALALAIFLAFWLFSTAANITAFLVVAFLMVAGFGVRSMIYWECIVSYAKGMNTQQNK